MSLASQVSAGFVAVGNYIRDSVIPRLVPNGGTTGHVLTKTAGGFAWQASSGGGGGVSGLATIDLPDGRGVLEWYETVTATGVTASDVVQPWLDPGSDADENTADMIDLITLSATPGEDVITFGLTLFSPLSGPVKVQWKVA